MLDLAGRRCVVVGGGAVGRRKVAGLLAAGANVTLVDPRAEGEADERVERICAAYDPSCLTGARLVFAATDDAELNARVAADARRAGALVNAVDQPADCDFHVPAVAGDGDVVVAVGTGGASPALAAALKRQLAGHLPDRLGEYAEALAAARERVQAEVADPDRRGRILTSLAGPEGYDAFLTGGRDALLALARRA
jgi:siroheme synthase-like protein